MIAQAYCRVDGTGAIDKGNKNLSQWRKLARDIVKKGQPRTDAEGHAQPVLESLFMRAKCKTRITSCGLCNVELERTKGKDNRAHAMCNSCRVYPGFTQIDQWMRAKLKTGTSIQRSEWVRWIIHKLEVGSGEDIPMGQFHQARFDLYPKHDFADLKERMKKIDPSDIWRIWAWARIGKGKMEELGVDAGTITQALAERKKHPSPRKRKR